MKQIDITIPDFVEQTTRLSGDELGTQLRRKAALKMFELGQVSIGTAGAIAGLNFAEMLAECARCGSSLYNYPLSDVTEELEGDVASLHGAMGSVVSSAGPLIALATADALGVLKAVFREVMVSSAVHRELLSTEGAVSERLTAAFAGFIRVSDRVEPTADVVQASATLSPDEIQSLSLASRFQVRLLSDDRLERAAARALSLPVAGSLSVLVQARKGGSLPRLSVALAAMRQGGYWFTDAVFEIAAVLGGDRAN